MVEPITGNKSLIIPNTGDLPGAWGTAALNPNFQLIDAMFGGTTTISLSSATTILLSVPATTGVWAGSVPQSSNAMIKFTGAQTGSAIIQLTLPGFYIMDNRCTGTTSVQIAPASGTGSAIGLPPGKKTQLFFDGVDVDYVNPLDPGTAYDLHNATTYPPWMNVCTVRPYLIKDGATYSTSAYTALAAVLGSTFGGNGITTFGVPDERNRARVGLDVTINTTTAGRLTAAGSGVNGTTMGAAGGSQFTQTHTHTNVLSDPSHRHAAPAGAASFIVNGGTSGGANIALGGGAYNGGVASGSTATTSTGISLANASYGSGSSQNVMPIIVSFLPLIKT